MGKLLALVGKSNSGKTTAINLAARNFSAYNICGSQPVLIAKDYIFCRSKEIVEIFSVATPTGKKHVAYISHGDTYDLIQKSLDIIQYFVNFANDKKPLVDYSTSTLSCSGSHDRKKGMVVPKSKHYLYKAMEKYLESNYFAKGQKLTIDVLIVACHDDGYDEIAKRIIAEFKGKQTDKHFSYKAIGITELGKLPVELENQKPSNTEVESFENTVAQKIYSTAVSINNKIAEELCKPKI